MRNLALHGLIVVGVAVGATGAIELAMAQPFGAVEAVIEPSEGLTEGDHREMRLRVRVRPVGDPPILVTPTVEGAAIEVVRGRLLKSDAEPIEDGEWVFRVPILARGPGVAVLRVRVLAYVCDRGRCHPVEGATSITLRVARRDPPP